MTDINVSELAIYPVKSFAQLPLTSARVEPFGLQHDRRWMVIDNNGKFITQRQQSHTAAYTGPQEQLAYSPRNNMLRGLRSLCTVLRPEHSIPDKSRSGRKQEKRFYHAHTCKGSP